MPSIIMLRVSLESFNPLSVILLTPIVLNPIPLNVILLGLIVPSSILMSIILLRVILLSVILLSPIFISVILMSGTMPCVIYVLSYSGLIVIQSSVILPNVILLNAGAPV
jgi:hypothetical protein